MTRYEVHALGFPAHIIKATDAAAAKERYKAAHPRAKDITAAAIKGALE